MILAHVVDSWTRDPDRDRTAFYWATFIGGLAAPAFLFLAGVGSALSGASRQARGVSHPAVVRTLLRRGLIVFALAFAFRFQALVLGLGSPVDVLKVDVLNVMGLALMVAALVWGAARHAGARIVLALAATAAIAFVAPLVRVAAWVDRLPAPLQWYLRPTPGHTNFTLFPWIGFVTAGLASGTLLTAAHSARAERRAHVAIALLGLGGALAACWASLQPTIYAPGVSTFWGASPTFFFIRAGAVACLLPACWSLRRALPPWLGAVLATLGASSLFVYWVHVELVYGGVAIPIKRRVPFELAVVGTLALAYGLFRLVPAAKRWVARDGARPLIARRLVARLL